MKTFLQALMDASIDDDDFDAILRIWGIDGSEEDSFYSLEEVLIQRTQDPISARFVWEYLQPDEREVLYAILKHDEGKGIERTALQQLVGLPEERFDTALAMLFAYVLIPEEQSVLSTTARKGKKQEQKSFIYAFPNTMDIVFAVGKELFQPEADRSMQPLQALLAKYSPAHLYQLCKQYQFSVPSVMSKSPNMSRRLAEEIAARDDVLIYVPQLESEIKKLYVWLRARGGRASMHDVREFTSATDPALRKILHTLEDLAMAFDALSQGERVLFIPQDLLSPAPKEPSEPGEVRELQGGDEPRLVRSGEMTTLFDMATLVGVIYQQRIELTQSSSIMKRYLPKLRQLLSGLPRQSYYDDDAYTAMLFSVMNRMQLVKIANGGEGVKDHLKPGSMLAAWMKKSPALQVQDFLKVWEEGYYWVDMAGTNFQQTDYFFHPNSTAGRRVLLKHLNGFEKGRWFPVEELLDRIWEQDPTAFHTFPSLNKKERMKHSETYIKWRGRDAELYIGSLGSTLNELGLVSLGFGDATELKASEYRDPDWFMLTDLGADALAIYTANQNKKATPNAVAQNPQQRLLVQPNFELLLLQPDFSMLYELFPFAQVNQVSLVSKLTLTQTSVLKALENGHTVEQIIGVLTTYSQKELPQNVVYSIRDWSKNYREVSVSSILLIEAPDEATVKVLCSASKLKKFGFRALGSTAVVTESDVDVLELRRALEKEGIVVHIKGNIASQKQQNNVTYGRYR